MAETRRRQYTDEFKSEAVQLTRALTLVLSAKGLNTFWGPLPNPYETYQCLYLYI